MFVCIVGCAYCICTAYALDTDMRYTQVLRVYVNLQQVWIRTVVGYVSWLRLTVVFFNPLISDAHERVVCLYANYVLKGSFADHASLSQIIPYT